MADPTHIERLKQGVEVWNRWREENLQVRPDLSSASLCYDLCNVNLVGANLRGADFHNANLSNAKLRGVELHDANLIGAKLRGADLYEANLTGANLRGADLRNTDLSKAKLHYTNLMSSFLIGANLSNADLFQANLTNSSLKMAILINTRFVNVYLTGSCIQDLHLNSQTYFQDIYCDYIYLCDKLLGDFDERRPRNSNLFFDLREFEALIKQQQKAIDLVFVEGIDWQAFVQLFQELRRQYQDDDITIQGINRKDQAFVISLGTKLGADPIAIETSAKALYEEKLALLEAKYQELFQLQGDQLSFYREELNTKRQEALSLQKTVEILAEAQKVAAETQGKSINFYGTVNQANVGDVKFRDQKISIQNQQQQQSLSEAFEEIQILWEAFVAQGNSQNEEQFAQNLAEKAKQDRKFYQKLLDWGANVAELGSTELTKTAMGELAKNVVPKALSLVTTMLGL